MKTIELINNLALHDAPVYKIEFNFSKSTIILCYQQYISSSSSYNDFNLLFYNVSDIAFNGIRDFYIEEISNLDISFQNNKYHLSINFILGIGIEPWILEFYCDEIVHSRARAPRDLR
jgi:hypothetical protein